MRKALTDTPASYLEWARSYSASATTESVVSAAKRLRDWVHKNGCLDNVAERNLRVQALASVDLTGSESTFSMEKVFEDAEAFLAFLREAS